jgi:predicted alpha/beta superfamily hydrolase
VGRAAALAAVVSALAVSGAGRAADRVPVVFEVAAPAATPDGATLWLAGNDAALGGWNPAGVPLVRIGPHRHRATIEVERGALLEFKVTRGGWETVEKGPRGEEIQNRTHRAAGPDTVRVTVAAWRDQTGPAPPRRSTLTGDVRRHPGFESKWVRPRDVLVWLPPDYGRDPGRRYPVLYVHDGNNVFDDSTSFAGEWGLDETAERMIRAGEIPPFIAVAVYNTPERIAEYTPVPDGSGRGGRGPAYGRFLVEELKPFVDRTYRTRTGAGDTGVLGSSLGGLISLALAIDRPDVFRLVGCVSPAAWWADRAIVQRAASAPRSLRVWVDIGTDESTPSAGRRAWLEDARALRAALERAGLADDALHYEEVDGGRHNEAAWAARLDRILRFLFAPR